MTSKDRQTAAGAKVPVEHADAEAAGKTPERGKDRPGFDLGGAKERTGREARPNPVESEPVRNERQGGPSGAPRPSDD